MNEIAKIDTMDREDAITILGNSLYPGAKRESIELVLSYCRMNNMDPFLKPVHIVPTNVKVSSNPDRYETRDVLMPGIADYRIKAARSGDYGGKSEPEFGPDVTATLGGETVIFPAWCRVTVKRIVQGQAREFVATERWLENYATAGRNSEAPNKMWKKRAYGQLAKCAESQALRMAFPEFSAGYTAEEMEGRDTFDGPTIDAEPQRHAAAAVQRAPRVTGPVKPAATNGNGHRAPSDPLDLPLGHEWLVALKRALDCTASTAEVTAIGGHASVNDALSRPDTPPKVKQQITEMLADAYAKHAKIEADNAPENDPDGGPRIAGEAYVGAG